MLRQKQHLKFLLVTICNLKRRRAQWCLHQDFLRHLGELKFLDTSIEEHQDQYRSQILRMNGDIHHRDLFQDCPQFDNYCPHHCSHLLAN